jgi:CubicO group peptidase (beta-lactamase class C family)
MGPGMKGDIMDIDKRHHNSLLLFTSVILILSMLLVGCSPSTEDLEAVDYTPLPGDDWKVSTPEKQGLDPMLVAELYYNAAELETLYGLLVIKNGYLIAESYFNEGAVDRKDNRQSTTKSFISALVGIVLEQGYLSSVDQKMMDFFPEFAGQITDPRKEQITIREMLKMRSGYPWEESDDALWEAFWPGDYMPLIVDFPLTRDPGTEFQYSNLTSHWLGVIVARASNSDLKSFAQEHLFSPIDGEVGYWQQDADGNYLGHAEIEVTARDMAKFGLLYLNDGVFDGKQVISAEWVHDSLASYTQNPSSGSPKEGPNFNRTGYGYQWWALQSGDHHYNAALGHGGQVIAVLDELDLVVVATADPQYGQYGGKAWSNEKANKNLVANFIASLPSE